MERQIISLIKKFQLPINNLEKAHTRLSKILNKAITYTDSYYLKDPITSSQPIRILYNDNQNIDRLIDKLNHYKKVYTNCGGAIKVIDTFSEKFNKRPLYIYKSEDIEKIDKDVKRFTAINLSLYDFLEDKLKNIQGYLLETYILSELNNMKWKCPECKAKGSLGCCIEDVNVIEAFRDGVCLKCGTLFEIKSKKTLKRIIEKGGPYYGGDYITIHTLLEKNKNVYLILYDCETGEVYSGKIYDCFLRENEKYLYSIQDNVSVGTSYLKVKNLSLQTTISPADSYITEEKCQSISNIVLTRFKSK